MNYLQGRDRRHVKNSGEGDGGDELREQLRYYTCAKRPVYLNKAEMKKENYSTGKTFSINKRSNIKGHNITANV